MAFSLQWESDSGCGVIAIHLVPPGVASCAPRNVLPVGMGQTLPSPCA